MAQETWTLQSAKPRNSTGISAEAKIARTRKIMRGLVRESSERLHQIAVGALGISQYFFSVENRKIPVAHQHRTVDKHGLNIARLGAVHDLAENLVHRLRMRGVDIEQDQIGALA